MEELLKKEQIVSVVPQDFRNALKAKVVNVGEKTFDLEASREPKGFLVNNLIEFYSQTAHGVLYFQSDIIQIEGNKLKILNPIKHRFLQRRQFTRINFVRELMIEGQNKNYDIKTIDISAGGMRIKSRENINLDEAYKINIALSDEQVINCFFEPIRIEKQDVEAYTLSGRFKNLSNVDKMSLIQFCMKKKIETLNK